MEQYRHGFTNASILEIQPKFQMATEETVDNLTKNQLAEHLNEEFSKAVLPVTIFVGVEILLGFFGNLIVLYVYLFHYHVCNFRYFVLSLAFIDILSTLTTMPGEIVTQLNWYVYTLREVCKVKSFFNMFTVSVEALCLLIIAFDRYRKVCKPFGWQIKPRTSISICCAIYIIALLLSAPVPFFWGLHYHQKNYKNTEINVTVCEKDERFKDTIYPLIYSISMETIMSISLLVMLVLYILVAKRLLHERRKQKNSGSPMVVITPPDNETNPPDITVGTASDISDTGYSSGLYKKTIDIKIDEVNVSSDGESATLETDAHLKVPSKSCRRKTPFDNVEKETSCGKQRTPREKMTISDRVRRKTLIMFILTLTFVVTTLLYMTLLSFIAKSDNILQKMSHPGKAAYFFFFRLYFLNHVINPVVYGLLDPRFRKAISKISSTDRRLAKSVK